MTGDPLVEVAVLVAVCVLVWRWLHRSPLVRVPSWFMVEEPPPAFRIVPRPPYDWARDPEL